MTHRGLLPSSTLTTPTFQVAALGGALALNGCGQEYGAVEVAWQFVDRDGTAIFPQGLFERNDRGACDRPGFTMPGQFTTYDLSVELEICDTTCPAGCEDPSCFVIDPLQFSCRTFRGAEQNIPASDDPYLFTLRPVIGVDASDTTCRNPAPSCLATPGPRERRVDEGLVVDLQVYQILVDIELAEPDEDALDLEECGCA